MATPSIIQGALDKILGPSAESADVALTPKTPLSYIAGAMDQFGAGGDTSQQLSNVTPDYVPPDVLAARASSEESARQLAALQAQIDSYNTPAPTTTAAATPAAAPAAAAAPAQKMTLNEYDRWMTELSNQKRYQDYGGKNIQFRDPSQGSWTDWLKGHAQPGKWGGVAYNIGPQKWGASGSKMVDPTTGQIEGAQKYLYPGVSYRPQTGDASKDYVIENYARGGAAPTYLLSQNTAAAGGAATGGGTAAAPAAAAAPVNPGAYTGKGTWQQQAQYWKDLDAFNKYNKLGAYK